MLTKRLPSLVFVVLAVGVVVLLAGLCFTLLLARPLGRSLAVNPGQPEQAEEISDPTPDAAPEPTDQPEQVSEPTPEATSEQADQPEQVPEPTPEATPEQADQPEQIREPTPEAAPAQAEQPMTLLVLGIGQWYGENEAEAIYVVEVDPSGQQVAVTTFPPSLEVDVAGLEPLGITSGRLKMVYHHGLELPGADEVSAASLVAGALVDNFNITPDHYIVVQEDYLASMIDTLGGIDVSLLATFGDMPPGDHHLDGETTWRYVSSMPRPGIPEELPRIERHKYVLKALRDKLLSASTLPVIPELLTEFIVQRGIKTDLNGRQILYLIGVLGDTSLDDISFTVIDGS